jgi:hypothetical protein
MLSKIPNSVLLGVTTLDVKSVRVEHHFFLFGSAVARYHRAADIERHFIEYPRSRGPLTCFTRHFGAFLLVCWSPLA